MTRKEIFYLLFGVDTETNQNELIDVKTDHEYIEEVRKYQETQDRFTGLVTVRTTWEQALTLITVYTQEEVEL